MASLDFDQKFLGRIAKQTADHSPLLSSSLYQILGLSVLLARRLIRARKLRKLDTSRDTPSLALYQHILWLSREGLSVLELYVLPYAQDNQHGPECRVLSVKLRASFYHIFCLFHNQPPITATNMTTTDPRTVGAPPLPLPGRTSNGRTRTGDPSSLPPPWKRGGGQPLLREPIDSIVSETSFVTNPYAAGGPVGIPSPAPPNAPPGLRPVPIPQPSSFILPSLNFVPLAGGYFTTATAYATSFLPGSHPLRLSVALEHSAFLWDCLHDHDGSRRIARRAIKDVYRAQEAMDDTEFEDAAELVGILGRMMKRKSWEGTPRVGGVGSPPPTTPTAPLPNGVQVNGGGSPQQNGITASSHVIPEAHSRTVNGAPTTVSFAENQARGATHNRSDATPSKMRQGHSDRQETTPRSETQRFTRGESLETTPHARHAGKENGTYTTPRVPQSRRSPATPSAVRPVHAHPKNGNLTKGSPDMGDFTPITPSSPAVLPSATVRASPTLRRSPPLRLSPAQESAYQNQR